MNPQSAPLTCPLAHQQQAIAAQIQALQFAAYTQEAQLLGITDFPPLQRQTAHIQAEQAQYFGIWHAQKLVAAIALEQQADAILISSLVVAPDHQRQGLARRLLSHVFSHVLSQIPANNICVSTAADNLPALNLYQAYGFVPYQQREVRLGDGGQLVLLDLCRRP